MSDSNSMDTAFLSRLTEAVRNNLGDEQFGVSRLVRIIGKSQSYIHRQLKNHRNQNISRFIRTERLKKAMELLLETELPASEIAFRVGIGSPAYFSRCFHEYYGFPPGEARKRQLLGGDVMRNLPNSRSETGQTIVSSESLSDSITSSKRIKTIILIPVIVAIITLLFFVIVKRKTDFYKGKAHNLSIVVLPFKNYSNDPGNQYFADGIMEDILNDLFRITSLRVVSRTTAEQFRQTNLTAREIANKLQVNFVLEGSVRMYEDKTRISVQLIDARSDQHLWSAGFDRELTDIIGVQSDIALRVAQELKAVMTDSEIKQIEKVSTQNPEAYDYYLRARFLLHKANSLQRADFNSTGVLNCLQYYEKAIEADSTFAEAYAGLANAWFNLSAWGFLPASEGFPKARTYSMKALEYDLDCAEAHAVMGAHFIWGGEQNIAEGSKELKKAVELNPNFSTAHQWYAQSLMITGPIEDARMHINRALDLEPYFWVTQTLNAWIFYFERKYLKAIEASKIARDLNPIYSSNNWLLVLIYAKLGEGEKMLQELQSIIKKYAQNEKYLEEVKIAYDEKGINGIFIWLDEVNQNNPIPVEGMDGHPFYSAWWNAILGNKNEAIYWLEQTLEDPRPLGHYSNLITTNPDFDDLRNDTRFLKVIEKKGLTAYHNHLMK